MNHDAFIRRKEAEIPYYVCKDLQNINGLYHGFSTRHGGANPVAESFFDLGEAARDNRRRFLSALHLADMNLITLRQIHSGKFIIIREKCSQGIPTEGDALVTQVKNVALAVMVADCLPVLVADPVTRVSAAIHAGWKGILAGIFEKTIAGMRHSFGVRESDLIVAIGPGIRSCCFEVGSDVVDLFDKAYPAHPLAIPHPVHRGKWLLDLRAALNVQFSSSNIHKEKIFDLETCTCCNTQEFFSYRCEGYSAGRMMAVIGMDS